MLQGLFLQSQHVVEADAEKAGIKAYYSFNSIVGCLNRRRSLTHRYAARNQTRIVRLIGGQRRGKTVLQRRNVHRHRNNVRKCSFSLHLRNNLCSSQDTERVGFEPTRQQCPRFSRPVR